MGEALGLKTRTATNWIQRARAAGFMTSTDHAKDVRSLARKLAPYLEVPEGAEALADELTPLVNGGTNHGHD